MEGQTPPTTPSAPPTLPLYTSISWPPFHSELYEKVYQMLLKKGLFFNSSSAREQPPYVFKTPEELRGEIDFTLGQKGVDHKQILEYFEKLIAYSPHHSHPFYLSKDGTGLDPYAIAGDFTANILSTAVLTYLFAPVFTLQESVVEMNIRKLCGYSNPEKGDGVQVPGGGFATSMAISAAVNFAYPDISEKGFAGIEDHKMAVFASENCNDFVEKACIVAGLGMQAFVKVRADHNGRMNVNQLRQQIQRSQSRGIQPLMVIATVGTDPVGAIDPIPEIAAFCEENSIWLHVDGSYAGALIFSDEFRNGRLAGMEKSSSFALGGTGMLGTPWCDTIMVTPHHDQFFKTFGVGAEVVFEPTLLYDSKYDNGDRTLQTSRRGDVTKLWLMWKVKGRNGIGKHVKFIMDLATEFNEEVKRRSTFHAIMPFIDSTRVAFYYVPPKYRLFPRNMDYMNFTMSTLSRKIKNKLLTRGSVFLSLSKVRGYPECFAVSISNSALTLEDLKFVLDEIEGAGREIAGKASSSSWPLMPVLPDSIWKIYQYISPWSSSEERNENIKIENIGRVSYYGSAPPPPPDSYPSFVNSPIESLHLNLFKHITKLFDTKGLYFQNKRDQPLVCFRAPNDLMNEFDLSLGDQPKLKNDSDIIKSLAKMIRYSIHQAHPFYVYQLLSGGLDPYTIMGDFMLTAMTSHMLTYEEGPLYTIMEEEVLKACRKRIGFPEEGDGMLTPGGTIGNVTAILVARLALFPEQKQQGLNSQSELKLVLYISKNAHYCFQKGSLLQGIGLDNCVAIEPDQDGRMDTNELRKAVAKTKSEGGTPFFVGCTAGTTVLGVFDNITEIYKICKENNMWMHIDGSVGGSAMFSDFQLKDKLSNAHLANSMNFNPHKWFGATQETSVLMFRQKEIVKQTLGIGQDYRSGGDNSRSWFWWRTPSKPDVSRTYDSSAAFGDLAAHGGIGWERRPNVIKLWLLWKTKGIEGMGKHIDYTYANKDFLVEELSKPERKKMFQLVKPDYECPGVCFYYLPESIREMDRNSEEFKKRVEKVALPLQARLVRNDVTIIPIFRDGKSPLFTKFTILSSGVNKTDLVYLLDAMDYYGKDLPTD